MKKLLFLAALVSSFTAQSSDIKTTGSGNLDLDIYRGRAVFVEFESSQKLTSELRERFEALGYALAPSAGEADVAVKVMAGYFFQKPRAKAQQIDFGRVVEQVNSDLVNQKASESTRVVGVELAPLAQGLRGNLSSNMVLGVGLVDSILSLSGARGWFNKLVSGDERGVCLGTAEMCKDWKKYEQHMRFAAFVSPKAGGKSVIRAEVATNSEDLLPDLLFHVGMGELTNRLFSPQVPAVTAVEGAARGGVEIVESATGAAR